MTETGVQRAGPLPDGGPGNQLRESGEQGMAALRRAGAWMFEQVERLCALRHWRLVAALVILGASLLASFPSLDALGGDGWDAVQEVGARPFTDLGFSSASHESKNLYRVTMPIVGDALGLSPAGYMALQAAFGVLLIVALLVALERATGDRVTAFLFTLTACMTYGGVVAFVEVRGIFDGVALALLLVALAWPRVPLIAVMVFLAGWTDERALLAAGFLVAYFVFEQRARPERANTARILAVVGGAGAYAVSRLAVVAAFDLPQDTGGVGPGVLLDQINNIAVGIWTGLEGLWVALAMAVFLMWRARLRLLALFTVGVTGVVALFAVSVVDITRSMAYLLPSVVLSALVLSTMLPRRTVRRIALVCLVLSITWPIYYVGGPRTIGWIYPLPIQIFRFVTGAGA